MALVRLLDVAEDVPYNVQRIAYVAWELLRDEPEDPFLGAWLRYVQEGPM